MKTIHKWVLPIVDRQNLLMPEASRIIHVGVQQNQLCVWAIVDTERQLEERTFWIVGTGQPIPVGVIDRPPLGTVQISDFVWHLFEER